MKREEEEAQKGFVQQEEDARERARIEWVIRAYTALKSWFQSTENQELLARITANKVDYLIYRGAWYERSLKILHLGTFGGVPQVQEGEDLLQN